MLHKEELERSRRDEGAGTKPLMQRGTQLPYLRGYAIRLACLRSHVLRQSDFLDFELEAA